jgi:phosphatidylserine decarboxylase
LAVPAPLQSRIAPQAWWPAGILFGVAALAGVFGLGWIAGSALVLAAGNLAFFRNPRRVPPPGQQVVVAPGDGRVVEVTRIEDPDGFVGAGWRIAIFLSIFNVHINCAPLSGKVRAVRRKGTSFRAAFNKSASDLNVQSRIDLETPAGIRLAVVQITGLVARRIISYPVEGDELVRGEPYGLICYGSRMEIYLPASVQPCVAPGDRVKGCLSAIAELPA